MISIGWITIAIVFGIARGGSIQIGQVVQSVAGVAAFLFLSLTVGRPAVAFAIRFVNDNFVSELPVITLILIIMGAMALITDALGVQSVLGAFVAGLLIGELPILTKHINVQLRGMVTSFFAPIFFALAGLTSDLTVLKSPTLAVLTFGLVLIASIGKFAGAFLGGAIGRLSRREIFGARRRHERARFDGGHHCQHRPFNRRPQPESLYDDRHNGCANHLRNAADAALGVVAGAAAAR